MSEMALIERERLRKQTRELRSAQGSSEVVRKSSAVCAFLRQIPEIQKAQVIMAYAAIKQEVDINPYWQEEWSWGKTVVLPRVVGNQLEAVKFSGWEETRPGPFGLWEPEGEAFPPEKIEAVLVPGVVFDRQGHRLGYGKGYYDRFLPLLGSSSFFCGIAYELQLTDDTYPTDWDVGLHALVTENQILRITSK